MIWDACGAPATDHLQALIAERPVTLVVTISPSGSVASPPQVICPMTTAGRTQTTGQPFPMS